VPKELKDESRKTGGKQNKPSNFGEGTTIILEKDIKLIRGGEGGLKKKTCWVQPLKRRKRDVLWEHQKTTCPTWEWGFFGGEA